MPGNVLNQLRINNINDAIPGTLCSNPCTLSAEIIALADVVSLSNPSGFLQRYHQKQTAMFNDLFYLVTGILRPSSVS